jgi:putative ubiquitin-RnfH superfamily antitoxin RatB of RatAB toxin-antitoxin module
MAEELTIQVVVVYSPAPRELLEWPLALPEGATVLQALHASGLPQLLSPGDWRAANVGVWGRKCRLDQVLREHDRVEVYRSLRVDPKVARRERFRKQGARAAGLFTRPQGGPGSR